MNERMRMLACHLSSLPIPIALDRELLWKGAHDRGDVAMARNSVNLKQQDAQQPNVQPHRNRAFEAGGRLQWNPLFCRSVEATCEDG